MNIVIILTLLQIIIGTLGCGKKNLTCEEAKQWYEDLHKISQDFDRSIKLKNKQTLINLRDKGYNDCLHLSGLREQCIIEDEKIDISKKEHKLDCEKWLKNANRDIANIH